MILSFHDQFIPPFHPSVVVFAYVLDAVAGDPTWLPHPVQWIGRLIALLEGLLRRFASSPSGERVAGALLALVVPVSAYAAVAMIAGLAYRYSEPLYLAFYAYVCFSALCAGSLKAEAASVMDALGPSTSAPGLEAARTRVGRIVGRDTGALSKTGVMRAVTETVAENTSDGVVAPLFYLAIGGPPLMLAYKAVNTLDSMVGYKNERYVNFGLVPARLDDAANFIPARLTALLMVISAFFLGYNWRGAMRVLRRDGRKHPSPNAGLPEAAAAGALDVRLGGPSSYGGIMHDKPFIGDGPGEPDIKSATGSLRLMRLTAFFMLAITVAALYALKGLR